MNIEDWRQLAGGSKLGDFNYTIVKTFRDGQG